MKIGTFCGATAILAATLVASAQAGVASPWLTPAKPAVVTHQGSAPTDATASPDSLRMSLEKRNKAHVLRAYDTVFGEGRTDLVDRFFARDLIQHDSEMTAGLQGVVDHVKRNLATSPRPIVTIKHTIADGPYVVVHSHVSATPHDLFSGTARFDLYRLSKGMIVEHWAIPQPVSPSTVNGNSMFNDAYQYAQPPVPATQAQEDTNKQTFSKAMTMLFVGRNLDVLNYYWSGDAYVQHNPRMPNGVSGVRGLAATMGPAAFQPRFVVAEGDLVFVFSQFVFGWPGAPIKLNSDYVGSAVGDLARVVNGVMVEHWDTMFNVPATSINGNSVFSELYVDPF